MVALSKHDDIVQILTWNVEWLVLYEEFLGTGKKNGEKDMLTCGKILSDHEDRLSSN